MIYTDAQRRAFAKRVHKLETMVANAKRRYDDISRAAHEHGGGRVEAVRALRADLKRIRDSGRSLPVGYAIRGLADLRHTLEVGERMMLHTPRGRATALKPKKRVKIRYGKPGVVGGRIIG